MRSPLIHFSEPEAHALLSERAHARELEFLAGQIGEVTFLRSLMIYGHSHESARHALVRLRDGH
jgi:hypothetical protein